MSNPFLRETEDYKRNLNVLGTYVDDNAFYLHKRTGQPLERCKEFVVREISSNGTLPVTDPDCAVLTKHTPGNREAETIPYSQYLKDIVQNDRTISPAGIVYINKDEKPSVLSDFIDVNIQKRSVSKDEMFVFQQNNDHFMTNFKDNEQTSFKISNNSLSGAQASGGTMVFNPTAHPSLTSTCRIGTSYGNAITEKYLFGNRHYWSVEIARANIVSLLTSIDREQFDTCMKHYGIHYPTAEETYETVIYSVDLYVDNPVEKEDLRHFIATLSPLERSIVTYTQDLYHLSKYNDVLVRTFLGKLSQKKTDPVEDPDSHINALDSDLRVLASLLCEDELSGKTIVRLKEEDPSGYMTLAATAKGIMETLAEYDLLIKSFWGVNTCPSSIAHIRDSLRRGVITSDTDSTIFTNQAWTEWYVGKLDFSAKSKAISYAVTYLDTQLIAHMLAMASAGMGVRDRELYDFSMKNEFVFPVFVLTSMAKHYFAYVSAREGNVFEELDTEIKGVYLKDSNAPVHVMQDFHGTLEWVMSSIMETGSVSVQEVLQHVSFIEKEVENSVRKGDTFYLKNSQIKDPGTYANPMVSPYAQHLMWEAVFAPKYGSAGEPPYAAAQASIDFTNKTKIMEWVTSLEDRALGERMVKWMGENKKSAMRNLLVPRSIVEVSGMPEEVIRAMDIRKLIYMTTKQYYLLLESLGLYMINDNLTRLVSDNVTPKAREGYLSQ